MLSRAKITAGRAAYYTDSVANGLDEYLSGAGEAPGVWAGSGAAFEGLSGVVSAIQVQRLFEGADSCHPVTGELLGNTYAVGDGVDKVSGWDLTLSAPKSFSTLWAVADPDLRRMLDLCHSEAVDTAIWFVERHGAFSRRGHAGRFQIDTRGLLIARFDHRTSRAGDPQRHTHLLVSNRVLCRDGTWRALDSRALHAQLKAAGAVYQAALRAETTARVGVRWGLADRNGQADIDDVPTKLTGRWSTRRNDVVRRAADRIAVSEQELGRELTLAERRKEFATATLETRPAKATDGGGVHDRWIEEAAEIGAHPAAWLDRAVGHRTVDEVGLDGIGGMALDDLADERSTWGRPDLVVALGALLPPQAKSTARETAMLVDKLADQLLQDPRVVPLTNASTALGVPRRIDGLPMDVVHNHSKFTTTRTLAVELEVLDFAHQDVFDRAVVEPEHATEILDQMSLSADQRSAVERVTTDGAPLSCLVGPAGTGKTTTIGAAAEVWRTGGHNVRGVAVSAVAADVLGAGLGVRADTIAKLLWENRRPDVRPEFQIRRGEVIVVDEASMVTSEQFAQLTRLAQHAEAKIVAVGDYRQLGAVDAGGMFKLLARDSAELTGAWRFTHQWERDATLALRDRVRGVTDTYDNEGRIHRGEGEHTLDAIVQQWAASVAEGRSVVMLASRRDDTEALSFLGREHLINQRVVQRRGIDVGGQTIGVGDQVVTLRNDRRMLTSTGHWVRNGDRWQVTETSPHGELRVHNDQRGDIWLPQEYVAEHVALGYALTVHKAQGVTVDHSIMLVDETTSAEALYVGMTRGRQMNEAFVWVDDPDQDHVAVFESAVSRDTTEDAALDTWAQNTPADERTAEEIEADLVAIARQLIYGDNPPEPLSPPHVQTAAIEIDDGMDIGW